MSRLASPAATARIVGGVAEMSDCGRMIQNLDGPVLFKPFALRDLGVPIARVLATV